MSTKSSDRDRELGEIHLEVGSIVAQKTARQTEVTHRLELTFSNLSYRLLDLTDLREVYGGTSFVSSGERGQHYDARIGQDRFSAFQWE